LDLEADLSIDSIKRTEILGELAGRLGLGSARGGELDESVVEELAAIKTVDGIVDWIVANSAGTGAASPDGSGVAPTVPSAVTAWTVPPGAVPAQPTPARYGDAAPAPAAPTPGTAGPLSRPVVLDTVVEVIGSQTGYPAEMLEPGLDLEADLSIDSIKRTEILGELAGRLGLAAGGELDESVVEELAAIKTVDGIVDWIVAHTGPAAEDGQTAGPAAASP